MVWVRQRYVGANDRQIGEFAVAPEEPVANWLVVVRDEQDDSGRR